ncbi:aldo/keto reductase [Escherichia coli]
MLRADAVPLLREKAVYACPRYRSVYGTISVTLTRWYQRAIWKAFDLGITHFDLANNYGPPPGSAEENFGRLLREDFAAYRDD